MATKRGAALNRRHAAICAALLLYLFALAGCGAQQQLTAGETDAALAALDDVERAVDDGDCRRAEAAARKLSALALATDNQGDGDFSDAYRQSTERLEELVARECEPAPSEPTGASGVTGETGTTGATDGGGTDNGGVTPTPDTGGNNQGGNNQGGNNQGGGNDQGGGRQPPADGGGGGGNGGGGVGNPDSGGVRPP